MSDRVTVDGNGYATLHVDTRYNIRYGTRLYHCGGRICKSYTCRGDYTTSIYVNWGDGSSSTYYPDSVPYEGCICCQNYFSTSYFNHQYPEGIFHIWGYEYYKYYGGTTRKRRFDLYNVDGQWVHWYADCGDVDWTGNSDLASWSGNYGIIWDGNSFEVPIRDVYYAALGTNWFLSILGIGVEELFNIWFGEGWLDTQLADKYFPWMSNWSYWMSNSASIWPWDWWWTNWAPGFDGPGRVGLDVEGVFHSYDDPLTALDICNRNAGSSEIHAGFDISWVGYPEPLHVGQQMFIFDTSLGMSTLLYSFGDQDHSNSSEREPVFVYSYPGVYTITQMCYPREDIQQLPITYTKTVTVAESGSYGAECSIWPVPDGWSEQASLFATKVEIDPGDYVTFYLSSDSSCGCDVATLWTGEWDVYDSEGQIYTENDATYLNPWTVRVQYNASGRWTPRALFRNTETNAYVRVTSVDIWVTGGDEDDYEDDEDDPWPDYPVNDPPLTPPPASMHRYLRLSGSDWSDGKTWDTAYKTWKKAVNNTPEGGWLHVDIDDYRHQIPVEFTKNIVIVPQEDFREVGSYKHVVLPSYGEDDGWWPFW